MSETVYIETSIVGYLTVRPSNNLILMANLEFTRQWWNTRRDHFALYISQVVLDEVARGDAEMASRRLEILRDFSSLEVNQAVQDLAVEFLAKSSLPPKAANDALHIAVATVYGLDYLLTWNCKHIANAQIQKKLSQISSAVGYELPTLCTPYELMGENDVEG
jgi:predicted nucleic acid-binding protein